MFKLTSEAKANVQNFINAVAVNPNSINIDCIERNWMLIADEKFNSGAKLIKCQIGCEYTKSGNCETFVINQTDVTI